MAGNEEAGREADAAESESGRRPLDAMRKERGNWRNRFDAKRTRPAEAHSGKEPGEQADAKSCYFIKRAQHGAPTSCAGSRRTQTPSRRISTSSIPSSAWRSRPGRRPRPSPAAFRLRRSPRLLEAPA